MRWTYRECGHSSLLFTASLRLITLRSSSAYLLIYYCLMGRYVGSVEHQISLCVCVYLCACVCVSRWLGRCLQDTEAGSEGVPVARGAGGGREQQQSIPWQHLHRCLCVCLLTSSLAGPKCQNTSFVKQDTGKVQLIKLCLGFVLFACFFLLFKGALNQFDMC